MEKVFGNPAAVATEHETQHWMSVSDLMAGLMMVFLFIAIALMRAAFIERDKIREVAVTYSENQVAIYEALDVEFADDLDKWDAEIQKETLEFRFNAPDVLFDQGSTELQTEFRAILDDFFPRYLEALQPFRESISELKIEGHTSSDWNSATTEDEAYFLNMALSQGRTLQVLQYVYDIAEAQNREWVRDYMAAVGYSSSRLVIDDKGLEDAERSRRVAFRIHTNAELQIRRILED